MSHLELTCEKQLNTGKPNDKTNGQIKEIEVCKKCPKVKPCCVHIFYPFMFILFFGWCKICKIVFFFVKAVKVWVYFLFVCEKSWIYPGGPSLWILQKISIIFFFITWIKANIFSFIFQGLWSTGPLNLIYIFSVAFLNFNWFFCNLTAAQDYFQATFKKYTFRKHTH